MPCNGNGPCRWEGQCVKSYEQVFVQNDGESDTFLCTFSGAGEQRGREGEKDESKEKVKQRRKRTKGIE